MHVDRFERYWLIIIAAVMGAFFAALLAGALIFGVRLPSNPTQYINPLAVDEEFPEPGLRDMGNGQYTVYILAQMWRFDLGSDEKDADGNDVIRVPAGSQVTFSITSRDVTHGFIIERHNANIEVVPGHVGNVTVKFETPGEYRMLCHEYCGQGHHRMHATIIVEE
ncbi:MAG: cupredoxin domain-containing protein [Anaerolineae bacterium]|nr:cupredoxin domain-containing protein [Anaerolineae bacterium]